MLYGGDVNMSVGERIRLLRNKCNYTQKELAEKAGVPVVTLQQYEREVRKQPKTEQLEKIAKALGTTAAYLLGYVDDLSTSKSAMFRKRLRETLNTADYSDKVSASITVQSCERILTGETPITLDKACEIAASLGVSLNYLIGITDDPDDDGPDPAAVLAFEKWGEQARKETLQEEERTERETPDKIKGAQAALLAKAMEICKDPADLDEAQQLHEQELMPSRIGCIIDFLEANKHFLHKNMPGMIPQDE